MEAPVSDSLATVAMIGGTDDETRAIVEEVLGALGIEPIVEGSVVYGVQVPREEYDRARDALRGEPRLAGRWIEYVDPPAP